MPLALWLALAVGAGPGAACVAGGEVVVDLVVGDQVVVDAVAVGIEDGLLVACAVVARVAVAVQVAVHQVGVRVVDVHRGGADVVVAVPGASLQVAPPSVVNSPRHVVVSVNVVRCSGARAKVNGVPPRA